MGDQQIGANTNSADHPVHWSCDESTISTRLTREFGLRHPFVGAGMGFVAHPPLVAAVSNAGGLGIIGASPDPPPSLPVMAAELRELTDGPWGVDLICAETGMGPASTDGHVDACVELAVPLVVFHHDLPPAHWVRRLTDAGARVWMQVSSVELAAGAAGLGVVGLVAQGVEAGGHARGVVPLHDLLAEIRGRFPGQLLLAAGGIADGVAAAAALRAGADGVWVGTRLVASAESPAHPEYKRRLVDAAGPPVVTTAFGPEWPAHRYRLLPTRAVAEWAGRESEVPDHPPAGVIGHTTLFPHSARLPYDMPTFSAIPPTVDTTGEWEEMVFPAGAGVGLVRDVQPVEQIVTGMMSEAHRLLSTS
ncbi:NAD(P)H-dependent flavin oxidoreductase [Pseudonocardia xinjiangensis]|uniref:NAD(P)H-dependent flavin oxidoreductase n=1 Tax=Pseudonocardia xinjiangensis TaxID=75289 RepID=UPI003D902727